MATLSPNVLTMADWAKRQEPDGGTATDIVELLAQTNEMLDDMLFVEGNKTTGHLTTVRTSLPNTYWRSLNEPVQVSKSTTRQFTEPTAIHEAWSETDVALVELQNDAAAFRLSEASAFIEAMAQEHQDTVLHGNGGTNPEEFDGFLPRLSSTSLVNGQNVILGGGAGSDNASILLIGWGERTIHGIFPKGMASTVGITHNDLGIQTIAGTGDVGGTRLRVYQDQFVQKTGLCMRDWRYAVRIANLDVSDMQAGNVNLIELMIKAIHRLPELRSVRPAFYCNRTVREYLDILAMNKGNVMMKVGEEEGRLKTTMRGIPIRTVDKMGIAETLVS